MYSPISYSDRELLMEGGWDLRFRTPVNEKTRITKSGIAEIKPHKADRIKEGLYQLQDYMRQARPTRETAWLITYLPDPVGTPFPKRLRIFAHQLNTTKLDALRPRDKKSLEDLVIARRELCPVALPASKYFPSITKADWFGHAVEGMVRDEFRAAYGRPGNPRYKQQEQYGRGPDILWMEVAELVHELAEQTGDAFLHELSTEMGISR